MLEVFFIVLRKRMIVTMKNKRKKDFSDLAILFQNEPEIRNKTIFFRPYKNLYSFCEVTWVNVQIVRETFPGEIQNSIYFLKIKFY